MPRKSQAQLLTLFLILLLLPATIIVAQTLSDSNSSITGMVIADGSISGDNGTQNVTAPLQEDVCADVICASLNAICPDGFLATCENACNPETGQCPACVPDCSGHDIKPEEPEPVCQENWECSEWGSCENGTQKRACNDINGCGTGNGKPEEERVCQQENPVCGLSCGTCESLDGNACVCSPVSPCCGNGICENGEPGETPEACPADCTAPPVKEEPQLVVDIFSPDAVTRDQFTEVSAVVKNIANVDAANVNIEWVLPENFQLVEGSLNVDAGTIAAGSEFTSSLKVVAAAGSPLGVKEIKVRVKYE